MVRQRFLGLSTLVLAGLVGLLVQSVTMRAAEPPEVPGIERVKEGMTAAEVKRALGPPSRIVRLILYRRQLAQWTYEAKSSFWLEIEQVKGQEARVRAVHPLRAPKRN